MKPFATTLLLWSRFTWRHWKSTPKSTLLLIAVLALGVGVFLSVRLANKAAVAGFSLFTETLTGNSDFIVTPTTDALDEQWLREMREALGPIPASLFPIVETTASEPNTGRSQDGFDAEQFQLIGLDLLALQNLVYLDDRDDAPPTSGLLAEPTREASTPAPKLTDLLGATNRVFISQTLATNRKLRPGDSLELIVNDRLGSFEIAGVMPDQEFRAKAPENLLLMDLPAVQLLSGKRGKIDRVEVRLASSERQPAQNDEVENKLVEAAQSRWLVDTPNTQRSAGRIMTRAFRLNLTALSCLALIVGVYLILQALEAAVVKRRSEIAILRSLGVPPRLIQFGWLAEAISLGIIGSLGGVALGFLGAQIAVRAVGASINVHYYSNTASAASLDPAECLLAVLAGIGASCLAGWLPARDAARTPPAQVLQRGMKVDGIKLLDHPVIGAAFIGVGLILYFQPPLELEGNVRFPLAGYLAAGCWVVGSSMLAGLFFPWLARAMKALGGGSPVIRYAASQLLKPTGRHRLTVAGLIIAISMAAGMNILIHSFESTIRSWIGYVVKADLFVAAQGIQNASSQNRLSPETWKALAADPEVDAVDIGQAHRVMIDGERAYLMGARYEQAGQRRDIVWVDAPAGGVANLLKDDSQKNFPAIVSESFTERFKKSVGDTLDAPTPSGERRLEIVGVFADYSSERGYLVVRREYLVEWFDDEHAINLAVYLKPGVDPESVRRRWAAANPGIAVRTNARLREEVLTIFRQTFSITYALKGIGVAVAVTGLALALIGLMLERKRELTTLKALGMSRVEIARATAVEGLGIALVGSVGGLALSLALGRLLIFVINKQSFGWTLAFQVPVGQLAALGGLILLTSAVVAYAAGYWGANLPADKEE